MNISLFYKQFLSFFNVERKFTDNFSLFAIIFHQNERRQEIAGVQRTLCEIAPVEQVLYFF